MILTDTHAHLYASEFDEDRNEMINRAIERGITRLFLPNIDLSSVEVLKTLSASHPDNCFPMMGMHPCSVKEGFREELDKIKTELFAGKYFGVGEIGIDLYWDRSTFDIQKSAFAEQLDWAAELGLPAIIHCRNSFEETISIVEEKKKVHGDRLKGIFHCFSGTVAHAERVFALNFYIGIGGVLTFKKSGVDQLIENIDLNRVLLETDAPYLAPVPYRGKRNESAYIYEIAQKIADLKHTTIEKVAEITTQNSKDLFGV